MNNLLWNNKIAAQEHEAVRTTAGWYYFTHHIIEVTGPDAAALLDYVYTNDIAGLAVGRARYTLMLGLDGIAQDDCIIFRIAEQTYWISTLHRPRTLVALTANKGTLDVDFRSRTEEIDMYAVQGPRSLELVNTVLAEPVDDLKFFQIADNKLGDINVKVARAGYTGEKLGFEIYCDADDHEKVEEALEAASPQFGALRVTTLDVMAYTLATEAGLVLVTDIDRSTPGECGMGRYIKWDKDFVGKAEALAAKDLPKSLHMWGITVDQKDHPDRVEKLILNATWPGGPNIVKPIQELWEYLTVPGMGGYDHFKETNPLRLVFSQATLQEMDEDVLESIADTFFSVRTTDLVGFQRQQVALRDFDVADRLCEVQCPALIAHGLYDCLIPCENAITIAKSIPDAEFLLLPNSSHASIEDGDLFQEAVIRFVEG